MMAENIMWILKQEEARGNRCIFISGHKKKQISEYGWMGSLGETYSTLYRILPRGYRVWASPAELYDAMIYVSDAHPIKVIED